MGVIPNSHPYLPGQMEMECWMVWDESYSATDDVSIRAIDPVLLQMLADTQHTFIKKEGKNKRVEGRKL